MGPFASMLRGMKAQTKHGRERVDTIALLVAAVAMLLVVVAVAVAFSLENVAKPLPTVTPLRILSGADSTATQSKLATADANEHIMAVTLAAVMQVTPGAVALGISAPGTAPAPDSATDFETQNVWVGLVGGEWASVYAGALRSDTQTGALLLVTVKPGRVDQKSFVLPLSQGALRLSGAMDQRLTLVSAGGLIYYFDVLAGRFVGSLTEYAETATPSSATATSAATAAATAARTPGATQTVTATPTP